MTPPPLALSAEERSKLFSTGVLAMREDVRPLVAADFVQAKRNPDYGKVKRIAERFVAGEWPGLDVEAVALQEGVAHGSLKNTVWKVRHDYKQPRRKSA